MEELIKHCSQLGRQAHVFIYAGCWLEERREENNFRGRTGVFFIQIGFINPVAKSKRKLSLWIGLVEWGLCFLLLLAVGCYLHGSNDYSHRGDAFLNSISRWLVC